MAGEAMALAREIKKDYEDEAWTAGEGTDDGAIDLSLHEWSFLDAATQIVVAVWAGKELK